MTRGSYASPALDNNEFATRAGPNEIVGWFSPPVQTSLSQHDQQHERDRDLRHDQGTTNVLSRGSRCRRVHL